MRLAYVRVTAPLTVSSITCGRRVGLRLSIRYYVVDSPVTFPLATQKLDCHFIVLSPHFCFWEM